MLHSTAHFDAGDIDKFNSSPFRRNNIVYHSKRRYQSSNINMHYNTTFEAVGKKSDDPQIDEMRFRTTNRDELSSEKVKFQIDPNPTTVFEDMAKASRKKLVVDGKPRGLLAHVDKGKTSRYFIGDKKSSL